MKGPRTPANAGRENPGLSGLGGRPAIPARSTDNNAPEVEMQRRPRVHLRRRQRRAGSRDRRSGRPRRSSRPRRARRPARRRAASVSPPHSHGVGIVDDDRHELLAQRLRRARAASAGLPMKSSRLSSLTANIVPGLERRLVGTELGAPGAPAGLDAQRVERVVAGVGEAERPAPRSLRAARGRRGAPSRSARRARSPARRRSSCAPRGRARGRGRSRASSRT